MEELSINNILDSSSLDNLFSEEVNDDSPLNDDENKETNETTEVDGDELFSDQSESVGGGNEDKSGQEDPESNEGGSSPKNNFYSSIAKALKEEGIFPDLDETTTKSIKDSEDLVKIFNEQIQARLDEKQRRIDEALGVGVEPSKVKSYESTLQYLDDIKDTALSDESDNGENLRKQLIFQDFINRGYSKERAQREVTKSFNAGTDIEDAKEALISNKEFYNNEYKSLIEESKRAEEAEVQALQKQAENIRKSILEDKEVFDGVELDKQVRQRVYDNITKPVFKDPESGEYLTAIQKYELENREDFIKKLGVVFTLTNGFKNLDGLVKSKVNKEVKKGIRNLENVINNTSRNSDGSLQFVSSLDNNSYSGKGFTLDV